MFQYNPKARCAPNRGWYLQIVSGKVLYDQMIIIHAKRNNDTFCTHFLNIFIHYPLGQMWITDAKWENWNDTSFKLWQTQINFSVFCISSICRVSAKHLNYRKHSMVRSLYWFCMYYHIRCALKQLQVPLPYGSGFNAHDNPYSSEGFFKVC